MRREIVGWSMEFIYEHVCDECFEKHKEDLLKKEERRCE